jgi:hypothetical protein
MTLPLSNLAERFEERKGYALAHISGIATLEQATAAVDRALHRARTQGIRRLLVDVCDLSGFPSPSLADRYFISRGWAAIASGQVELAVAMQPHLIDPDRFGVMVATNEGMRANVFSSQIEALEWLLSGRA